MLYQQMSGDLSVRVKTLHLNIAALEKRLTELEAKRDSAVVASDVIKEIPKNVSVPANSVIHNAEQKTIEAVAESSAETPVAVQKEKKKGDKPKKPAPAPAKKGFGEDRGAIVVDIASLKYDHNAFLPANVVDAETGYQNSNTNTDADIANAYNDNERRMRTLARDAGLKSAVFFRAPSTYYDWTLEQRQALLNAPTTHYLCKSMVMHNSKCTHDDYSDPRNSKYYLVVVQYTARLHNERLGQVIRSLSTPPPGRNAFNFRLCPPEVNDELTGFTHNGVTPLGMRQKIPIVLSDRIAKLDEGFFFLGAGEVDLKLRISVKDFIEYFNPIIGNITYDD